MSLPAPKLSHSDPVETTRRISEFLRGYSIEATRPTEADIAALKSAVPPGTQIYLSAVPKRPLSDLVVYAANVQAAGFAPVPHLAARSIESTGALDELLGQLATQARLRRVLVIAGDS